MSAIHHPRVENIMPYFDHYLDVDIEVEAYRFKISNRCESGIAIMYDPTQYSVSDKGFTEALIEAEKKAPLWQAVLSLQGLIFRIMNEPYPDYVDPAIVARNLILGWVKAEQVVACYELILATARESGIEPDIDTEDPFTILFRLSSEFIEHGTNWMIEHYPEQKTKKTKPGFVYILQSDSGFYKIGLTTNPNNRLQTFQVKMPFRVKYTLLIKSDDCQVLETSLHARFQAKRKDGEWFALESRDIKALREEFSEQLVSTK